MIGTAILLGKFVICKQRMQHLVGILQEAAGELVLLGFEIVALHEAAFGNVQNLCAWEGQQNW